VQLAAEPTVPLMLEMPGWLTLLTTNWDALVVPVTKLALAKQGVVSNVMVQGPAWKDSARVSVTWRLPSELMTMGFPAVETLEPAATPHPVTFTPGASFALFGTVIVKLPEVVPAAAVAVDVLPVIFSPKPTLVNEAIPNEVWLAVTFGGQIPPVQVYAVVDAVPAPVLPEADGLAPVARIWPIASPDVEFTVIWFDPGVTRVAVTDTVDWRREKVALAGKVVVLVPNAALKVTTLPAID